MPVVVSLTACPTLPVLTECLMPQTLQAMAVLSEPSSSAGSSMMGEFSSGRLQRPASAVQQGDVSHRRPLTTYPASVITYRRKRPSASRHHGDGSASTHGISSPLPRQHLRGLALTSRLLAGMAWHMMLAHQHKEAVLQVRRVRRAPQDERRLRVLLRGQRVHVLPHLKTQSEHLSTELTP